HSSCPDRTCQSASSGWKYQRSKAASSTWTSSQTNERCNVLMLNNGNDPFPYSVSAYPPSSVAVTTIYPTSCPSFSTMTTQPCMPAPSACFVHSPSFHSSKPASADNASIHSSICRSSERSAFSACPGLSCGFSTACTSGS